MVKTGKSGSTGALARSPGHLLHRVLQLSQEIHGEQAGPDGLTQRQFAVLEVVGGHQGLSQTELGRLTGIDRSTLAELVARMDMRGLLLRERSTLDARAMVVRLSPDGIAALEMARPVAAAADERLLALVPKTQRVAFVQVLTALARSADQRPDEVRAEARAAKKAERAVRKALKKAEKAAAKAAAGVTKAPSSKPRKVDKMPKAGKAKAASRSPKSTKP